MSTGRRITLLWAILSVATPLGVWGETLEVRISLDGVGGSFLVQPDVQSLHGLRRKNIVMQERDYSCGSASLATLFNYYLQTPVQETEIIKSLLELNEKKGTIAKVVERKGFSLLDLKQFAESRGFKANGYRLDYEDLVNIGAPVIVPIIPHGYKHFVVFRGADENRVYLADPSFGNLTVTPDQFKEDWHGFTNVALVVLPQDGAKLEGHPLELSEMDLVYAGQEVIDTMLYGAGPTIRLNPSEF